MQGADRTGTMDVRGSNKTGRGQISRIGKPLTCRPGNDKGGPLIYRAGTRGSSLICRTSTKDWGGVDSNIHTRVEPATLDQT